MADIMVEMHDIVTRFDTNLVHDHVSVQVRRGEILAVVGGSGSGKSTLMREMALLQRPTAGRVRVLGRDAYSFAEQASMSLRRHIGVLFQHGALFSDLTVAENVMVPLCEHTSLSPPFIAELAALKIALVGLPAEAATLYPAQLSGGMTKRAGLARAIALDPELLFLDEPVSGLDPVSADALDELVLQLKASLGLTIVMVTHDMDSLWRVADRVVLLGAGRILGDGTMAQLAGEANPLIRQFFHTPRGRAARHDETWTAK
jgi:phospholipid/cholesterol/gamma-HCH transport system ATP-binding protein